MLRMLLVALMAGSCFACGPLVIPMVSRLDDAEQRENDQMWHNLLANHVSREDFLGALTFYQLFESGVDRVDFHAEKLVDGNRVVMDVHFQRQVPVEDGFYVTIFDPTGKVVRSERYTRADMEQLQRDLTPRPNYQSPKTEEEAKLDPYTRHILAIQAATQPAQ